MASEQAIPTVPPRAGSPSAQPRLRTVGGLRTESVDALTLDEALLLARELPHLGKLIRGELDGVDRETARQLGSSAGGRKPWT